MTRPFQLGPFEPFPFESFVPASPWTGPDFSFPGAVGAWERAVSDDQEQASRMYQHARDWAESGDHGLALYAQHRAHGIHVACMFIVDRLQEHRRAP